MRHLLNLGLILLFASGTTAAQNPLAIVDALDGVDPVVLLQTNKEVFGKSEFSSERGRFRVRDRGVLRYYARTIEHLLAIPGRPH